jgi:hypothetical protein
MTADKSNTNSKAFSPWLTAASTGIAYSWWNLSKANYELIKYNKNN